jgi:Protein of unknown function (DUF1566)
MRRLPLSFLAIFAFLMLPVGTPGARAAERVHLRSHAQRLSADDVKSILVKHNFFDRTKNKNGAFANDIVDNGNGTVTDMATGLMWQQEGSPAGMTWAQAKEYVNKLNRERFAGHTGWRLPTIEELASLMKSGRAKGNLYVHPVFSSKQEYCWSADSFGPDMAWYASFKAGIIQHIYHFFYYARAVRTVRHDN